ncbi:Mini-ribonuclease 3 [Dysosmobacter sp.]|uniref:Mini-ribonuclease 3 n=1 Tax=Dysosmobacter sp. TaxID=2591382 RepID=UPI002A8DC939|nr:ribonuclease III domain-containing protein [Dysosmobacter sp.]MDY3282579.1 ribonuclease III domain-containing protein [Dysosmobacter sp.]
MFERCAAMDDLWNMTLTPDELRGISSIGLAHLGDAVYELLVRSYLCAEGKATGKGLHRATIELVRAEAQARRAEAILPLLTEEEAAVFRRGRNAQVHSVPAHASRAQYSEATALEALLGWLYLSGRKERINALFLEMMKAEG